MPMRNRVSATLHPASVANAHNSGGGRKNRAATILQAQSIAGPRGPKASWRGPQVGHRGRTAGLGTSRSAQQRPDASPEQMSPLPEARRGSRENARIFAE